MYSSSGQGVWSSFATDSVLLESKSDEKPWFAGMFQECTDRAATKLKANATVPYPAHLWYRSLRIILDAT